MCKNNILVKTTFKDNLILLKPFINFYNDIWKPEKYIIYIGYSQNNKEEIINNINKIINSKILFNKKLKEYTNHIKNTEVYSYSIYDFVLYETSINTPANVWDGVLRPFLYKLDIYIISKEYKFFLNLDNDDFFYIKDVNKLLGENNQIVNFHTFEFIPHKIFNIDNDFEFISNHYFYRLKGTKRNCSIKNSHGYCRTVYLTNRYKNETHTKKNNTCFLYDKIQNINIDNLDNVCFAFGCLDLNYLLYNKQWLQSSNTNTNKFYHTHDKVINDFNQYYTLNDYDKQNNIIFTYNSIKKYFI